MTGAERWTAVMLVACAFQACSSAEAERTQRVGTVDRVSATARPHPSDAGPVDAASMFDAIAYYCNVPEPGPCCCDPLVLELRRSEQARTSYSCEFALELQGPGWPLDTTKINIMVSDASGSDTVLPPVAECAPDAPGWELRAGEPPIARLCPVTCSAMVGGDIIAVKVMRGCPSIACPLR